MDQKKIGKFIANNRKEKKLTQAMLAEKLGVTDKTVSRWENGNYMPDLSYLKQLSEELGVTVNEILSGEKIEDGSFKEKSEENIINTIDYSNRKIIESKNIISIIFMVLGGIIIFLSMVTFPSSSSWGSIYSIIGAAVLVIGISRMLKNIKWCTNLVLSVIIFISILGMLIFTDYINVERNNEVPRYRYFVVTKDRKVAYYTLFYNVYGFNLNTSNEYYIIDKKKEYKFDDIKQSPFNRNKSGIDNLIKYKSGYVGDNSNDSAIINNLPLSEYGYVFEIDSKNLGLKISYSITDWYVSNITEELYIKRALLYNSVTIFSLIDNVDYIVYNFSGSSYRVEKKDVIQYYPNFGDIYNTQKIDKENYNKYLEEKMIDNMFVEEQFSNLLKISK